MRPLIGGVHHSATRPLRQWLGDPSKAYGRWLSRTSICVAWLGLGLAAFSPPHGSGIPMCWFQSTTGLPCIGCGLTRSLSCGIRGLLFESVHYHPLGPAVLALFVLIAGASLLPRSANNRIKAAMHSRPVVFNLLYLVFVSLLVGYGTTRCVLVLLHC